MNWQKSCLELSQALKEWLLIPQFAVAVRLLSPEEFDQNPAWLEGFRRPGKGMPDQVLTCQVMAMVRIYGWQALLSPQALDCPTGLLTLGWVQMSPEYLEGKIPVTPFNQSPEARARRMELVPCLPSGQVAALAAAPLHDCPFEPQVVVVYCNPAQAMRLVQASLFHEGGAVHSTASGAQGCSQYLTKVIQTNQPRYILPGNGDRVFGHVEEHQMAFSLPGREMGRMAEGITLSHQGGQLYPVQSYVRAPLRVPKAYAQASEHLRAYTQEQK